MKTNVEVLESGATKLTVTVEASEISARIKKLYKEYGTKYRFPGFRPGHVPRQIIDNAMGKEAVRAQVTDDVLNETYPLAVDAEDLNIIAQPKFEQIDALVVEGEDFTYSVELQLKPALELSSYDPVAIEVPFKTATEEEIDEQLAAIADYYFEYKNSPANTKVKADSTIEVTTKATDQDGAEVSVLTAQERMYTLGEGLFPAVIEEAMVGLKKGETGTVTFNPAENASMISEILTKRGTTECTVEFEIAAVKKKVSPELTDEWVSENLGFETVAVLRENTASQIAQQKEIMIPRIMENNALAALRERLVGEVPASMVDDQEGQLLQDFFTQLQQRGTTLDAYLAANGIDADQFKADVKKQAADTVADDLVLDAWARHEGIVVSDEEVREEFDKSGAEDPAALYEDWKAHGQLHTVREGITRGKAIESILAAAVVTEVEKLSAPEDAE